MPDIATEESVESLRAELRALKESVIHVGYVIMNAGGVNIHETYTLYGGPRGKKGERRWRSWAMEQAWKKYPSSAGFVMVHIHCWEVNVVTPDDVQVVTQ